MTGKLDTFAPNAKVIHIDIDPAEVNKNRNVDVAIVSDVSKAVRKINQKFPNYKFSCRTKNWLEKMIFGKINTLYMTRLKKEKFILRKFF